MGTFKTAWLIGSYASLPAQAFVVNASPQGVAASSYYLYDAVDALSLLAQVKTALEAAGLTNVVATLCVDRKVRLASSDAFGLTWGAGGTLIRDLLGFSGLGLAVATSHVADAVSPLLWSPGRQESSMLSPLGTRGHIDYITQQSVSPYSGRTESIGHGAREYQRFWFPLVMTERVRTATDEGGTFAKWFETVAVRSARWKLIRNVYENPASSAAAYLGNGTLGPYIYSAGGKGVAWTFTRSKGFERSEEAVDIDIPCHVCPEFTS